MAREEAIWRLENCLECTDCFTCGSHDGALVLAVAALREQEERSKGCPYCLYLEPLCRPDGDIIAIETDGKQYVIEGDYWGFDIKFCPKCGRKLDKEDA